MQQLIEESVINISREYSSDGVKDIIVQMRPKAEDTVDMLRAKFFLLIHQDEKMRKRLDMQQGKSSIVKEVDTHKACRFYDDLGSIVIPNYMQNQTISLQDFVQELRETYLCS